MLNRKLFFTSIILGVSGLVCANAQLALKDLTFPKPPAYRIGISSVPENQYIQTQEDRSIEKVLTKVDESSAAEGDVDVSYADLSIKRLSKEVAKELSYEERDMVSDLTLLWQGAATQSDTINFALYKLANPDADKPDKQSLKKVLSTIASMSTLVGASMASPVFAGSSLIGGNILNIMSQDTKALNYKYTKVTDADMIILIRKVEDLQQNAVDLYYDYMSARKQVNMINKLVEERERKFSLAQSNDASRELVVITDAYYRSALDKQRTARSNFLSKRAALEQFVGNEAFNQFEQELLEREKGEQNSSAAQDEDKAAYDQTIQNTTNYTRQIELRGAGTQTESGNSLNTSNYYDNNDDPNLKMLPDIQPLTENTPASKIEAQETSQPAVSTNSKNTAKSKSGRNSKKVVKEQNTTVSEPQTAADAAETTGRKVKEDKYSTKGIIFLHGKNKEDLKNTAASVQNKSQTPQKSHLDAQQQLSKDHNLMPLDEIAPPRNGHSIYEDLPY